MAGSALRFHHLHLRSHHPAALAEYLVAMLGGTAQPWRSAAAAGIDVRLGGIDIYISTATPAAGPAPPSPHLGLDHFGLAVPALDPLLADLRAKGADITSGPTTVTEGVRIAFLRGPDELCIELIEDLRPQGSPT